jgi:hypothetical protein
MSIYIFRQECPQLGTHSVSDAFLVYDATAGDTNWSDRAHIQSDVVAATGSSTSGTLVGTGTTVLNSTAQAAYVLAPPTYVGQVKYIVQTTTSTVARTVTGSTVGGATTLNGSNTIATFNTQNQAVILKAISATAWAVMSNVGSVSFS